MNQRTQIPSSHSGDASSQRWRAPLRGTEPRERKASPVPALVLPRDRLPFISLSPQGAQQQTTDGGRRERNTEEEKEGGFGRGGDGSKACAFPAKGQPVLFILVWLVCSRTGCQHNLFFLLLLLPEVMDVKQRRFYVHVKAQLSLLYL